MELSQHMVIHILANFSTENMMLLFPIPKIVDMGLSLYWGLHDYFPEGQLCRQLQLISCFSKKEKISHHQAWHILYLTKGETSIQHYHFVVECLEQYIQTQSSSLPICKHFQNPHFLYHYCNVHTRLEHHTVLLNFWLSPTLHFSIWTIFKN